MNIRPIQLFSLTLMLALSAEAPTNADEPQWVNVTNNVGGETWGYAGVTRMAVVPGSADVIAGVSEQGLWLSADKGATWKKLGAGDKEQIKHRPHQFIFDPTDPSTFWVSGCYGAGIFKTIDGGKSFVRLGNLNHVDGLAVDFSDPERKTMLAGLHEQAQSLQLSRDGGNTWDKIGGRLPEDSNFSSDPIMLDAKTFIVNAAGWKQKAKPGIYRSEDAGATWTAVSQAGPSGVALQAADGTIYWQLVYGGGLIRGTDEGRTWSATIKGVKTNPIELPNKRLAGINDSRLVVSSDNGTTWSNFGPPAPFKPNGVVYSPKDKCFYAWRLTDKIDTQSIVRLDLPID